MVVKEKLNFLLSYGTLYRVTPEEISQYKKKLEQAYQRADEICHEDKDVDRNIVVQSLLMAYQTPLENLNFALMRGQVFKRKYAQ